MIIWGHIAQLYLVLLTPPQHQNPSAHQEEHHADSDVGEDDAHPDLVGQWVQEGEDTRFGLGGFLDHDGDSQRHEGFGEVDHLLSNQSDGQWCNGQVGLLQGDGETSGHSTQEVSVLQCHPGCGPTHPVHQLPHHPIPQLGVRVSGTVLAVPHQLESVGETDMLGNLRGEFGAVTFVLLISHKLVMVLLQHHVWSFLLECTWRIQY